MEKFADLMQSFERSLRYQKISSFKCVIHISNNNNNNSNNNNNNNDNNDNNNNNNNNDSNNKLP